MTEDVHVCTSVVRKEESGDGGLRVVHSKRESRVEVDVKRAD